MSGGRRSIALAIAFALVACSPQPSSSPAASVPAGSSTPVASPSGETALPPSTLGQGGTIDQQFTTPALEYRSTGSLLLWSSAARADHEANTAPDLYASTAGGVASLIYDNPNRDSRLELVGGDDQRIVFVEDNARLFGSGAWKMWYLATPRARPQLIEEGAGKLPFFGISGSRLVWTEMGGQPARSGLWLLDLDTLDRHLLESVDAALGQYWFPSIDGSRIVFGKVERTADGQGEQRHVFLVDLEGDRTPRRLDTNEADGDGASQPAISGDTVVWKESSLDESHLVGGRLIRYSLSSGESSPLTLDPSEPRYTFPSIGGRYVAAWSGYDRALYLADLTTGDPAKIMDLGPTEQDPHASVGRIANLRGDLLAYVFGPSEGDLELRWIVLP